MNDYSILRVGNEYVVRANEKGILRMASLRIAERTLADAAELLDSQGSPPLSPGATGPTIVRDPRVIRDPRGILDPRFMPDRMAIPDPGTIPDPSEDS